MDTTGVKQGQSKGREIHPKNKPWKGCWETRKGKTRVGDQTMDGQMPERKRDTQQGQGRAGRTSGDLLSGKSRPHRPFSLHEGAKGREKAVGRGKAYDGRSLAALSPQPFFSVRITSTSACCFFWKRRLEQ